MSHSKRVAPTSYTVLTQALILTLETKKHFNTNITHVRFYKECTRILYTKSISLRI